MYLELEQKIVEVLKTIFDPEIPVNIYDLGLIYEIKVFDGIADILMTVTSPNCPVAESLPIEVNEQIKKIEGINEVSVRLTFEPPWDQNNMTPEARLELGFD